MATNILSLGARCDGCVFRGGEVKLCPAGALTSDLWPSHRNTSTKKKKTTSVHTACSIWLTDVAEISCMSPQGAGDSGERECVCACVWGSYSENVCVGEIEGLHRFDKHQLKTRRLRWPLVFSVCMSGHERDWRSRRRAWLFFGTPSLWHCSALCARCDVCQWTNC